jgi:hypothetical protein
MMMTFTINSDEVADALAARGEALPEAIAEAIGLAGESLYEAIMYNMTGGIIQSRTGLLASSVQLSPVVRKGSAATVWCEIRDNGSFEHLVGMVLEFGGHDYYPIVPLENKWWEQLGLFKGGAGIDRAGVESMFSEEGSIALAEGRLPHVLHWIGANGGDVFARSVNHPPSREFRYMRTSLEQVRETVRFQIVEAIAGVLA